MKLQDKRGRPTKFDAKKGRRVIALIKAGSFQSVAARAVGVHPSTITDWVRAAKSGDERFTKFAADLEAAHSVWETETLKTIARLAKSKKDAKTLLLLLQLRSPRRWAARVRVEVTDALEEFIKRVEGRVSPDVFEQILLAADAVDRAAEAGDDSVGEDATGD